MAFLLLVVVVAVVLFFRQRNLTHKSEKERLAQQIEKDEKIKQLLNEKVEIQQREFLANALAGEKQSKLYDEVQQQLKNIDPANGIEKAIKRVIQLIDNRRNDHVDILFKSYHKIKPGFLQKLQQHYPNNLCNPKRALNRRSSKSVQGG